MYILFLIKVHGLLAHSLIFNKYMTLHSCSVGKEFAMREILVQKNALEEGMATHSSILA